MTFRHDTGTTNGYGAGGIIPGYSATPPTASWASLLLKIMGFFIPSTVAAQVGIGVQ